MHLLCHFTWEFRSRHVHFSDRSSYKVASSVGPFELCALAVRSCCPLESFVEHDDDGRVAHVPFSQKKNCPWEESRVWDGANSHCVEVIEQAWRLGRG